MELRVQPRNCLQLFIATCLIYIVTCDSQHCIFDGECPAYAECLSRTCFCKYGSSHRGSSGILQSCPDHCTLDSDCVLWAECDWSFSPGRRCRCKYSGSSYIQEDAIICEGPIGIIIGSIIGIVVFITIVTTVSCIVIRRRRRLVQASHVGVYAQPAPVPMPPGSYQPVYPVQQYQQAAPPYSAYNNAGYGPSQPTAYNQATNQ